MALCFSTNYYFGPRVLPIVTLDWEDYTGGSNVGMKTTMWARIISASVVLFPVITVSAAFPLNMMPLAETLLKLVPTRSVFFFYVCRSLLAYN